MSRKTTGILYLVGAVLLVIATIRSLSSVGAQFNGLIHYNDILVVAIAYKFGLSFVIGLLIYTAITVHREKDLSVRACLMIFASVLVSELMSGGYVLTILVYLYIISLCVIIIRKDIN